jgi:choline dehydrogenase
LWHPTGTARMGRVDDGSAVVDSNLRVFGFTRGVNNDSPNLRIVDASVMPQITLGNTQCPTYTIGERAADFILP